MSEIAGSKDPILTLEPLLEAIREGLEGEGWELSGLQKTTSYEFEGRWAGDSSRSAYLFFHREGVADSASIDVFLDETSKGLKGNLALVIDGPELGRLPDPGLALEGLGKLAQEALPHGYRTPITLRYRLATPGEDPGGAESEIRFKISIPARAVRAGAGVVTELARTASKAFLQILLDPGLTPFMGQE